MHSASGSTLFHQSSARCETAPLAPKKIAYLKKKYICEASPRPRTFIFFSLQFSNLWRLQIQIRSGQVKIAEHTYLDILLNFPLQCQQNWKVTTALHCLVNKNCNRTLKNSGEWERLQFPPTQKWYRGTSGRFSRTRHYTYTQRKLSYHKINTLIMHQHPRNTR